MSATLKKKAKGYNYKYTDLAGIHEYLDQNGLSYYQYINILQNGDEQVMTVRNDIEQPIPGDVVQKAVLKDGKQNPAQAHGAALTYARRYSLYMAYGLATSDDDAECLTVSPDIPASVLVEDGKQTPIRKRMGKYFNEHALDAGLMMDEFGIVPGMPDDVLEAKFDLIKEEYGA